MTRLKEQVNRFKLIIVILLVFLVVAVFLIFRNTGLSRALPSQSLETVQVRDVEKKVSVEGNLTGVDTRQVFFSSGSKVKELKVSLNSRVKKDDVLGVLSIGAADFEVKSPISGFIAELNYKKDDAVLNPSLPGIVVIDDSKFNIEVLVNENDVIELKSGQTVKLILPAVSLDTEFDGEVTFVSGASESTSGAINYKVIIQPEKLPDSVRVGMSVDAKILTQKVDEVLSIPESFIIEKEEKFFVKKVSYTDDKKSDYKIEEIEVTIGLRTDEFVELKTGVSEGEELIEPSFTVERSFGFF